MFPSFYFQERAKERAERLITFKVLNLNNPLSFTAAKVAPVAIVQLEFIVLDAFVSKTCSTNSTNLGILDPPPTSSIESTFMFSFCSYYLKLVNRLLISLKTSLAAFIMIYLVNVSEKSSSQNKHQIEISVSEIPERIFLCL